MHQPILFDLARTAGKPLLLDGAFGSFYQKAIDPNNTLWSSEINLTNAKMVVNLHKKYIEAGADIITSNTFRSNPHAVKLSNDNIDYKKLVKKALRLAFKARGESSVLIAGANAPAEDCYAVKRTLSKKELEENHYLHIEELAANGADLILNETQSHLDEILIISQICSENKLPFIISLYFTPELKTLCGTEIKTAINKILKYNPLAIGFNCVKASLLDKLLNSIKINFNWGAYLNCGKGEQISKNIICETPPNVYADYFEKSVLRFSPSFFGGCCGTTPAHIKALRERIDKLYRNKSAGKN